MAYKPGILTDWPWKPLGNFKYAILAPSVIHSIYSFITKDKNELDMFNFLIFPFLLSRTLHNQIWISLSRYRTAKGNNRILNKGIEFEQVDRERNWDDQILFTGILAYLFNSSVKCASYLPWWRTDGVLITILTHAGPVEFLYYWLHRALHHHYLYSRYHSHHHSSIVTEPITSVIHPFAEHLAYFFLFSIPMMTILFTGTPSMMALFGYITYIDFMNNMGHCNFELIPKWLFSALPPLKYLMYTPSFHSLHHTQFQTNYSLFMPIYDYLYGTTDKSSDMLYEVSLEKKEEESADVVHLTHLTTPESIYHLQFGFASLASRPHMSKWYLWLMWPVTLWSMLLTWAYGHTFLVERHQFEDLKLQTWAIPKYKIQYFLQWQKESINRMIEDAILKANEKGIKVLSLGLLNQGEELNGYAGLYVNKHPKLKIKLVDGSTLAVAVVLNSIPKGTTQVLMRGSLTKVAYGIAFALQERDIKVVSPCKHEYEKLKKSLNNTELENNVIFSRNYAQQTWLVGDGLTEDEQFRAPKGTLFIPFSQFPPRKLRKDCSYQTTPAMLCPSSLENVHACENWLPRRVMSAWRIAGIVHALEGWDEHECGNTIFDIEKVLQASLQHGFQPLTV